MDIAQLAVQIETLTAVRNVGNLSKKIGEMRKVSEDVQRAANTFKALAVEIEKLGENFRKADENADNYAKELAKMHKEAQVAERASRSLSAAIREEERAAESLGRQYDKLSRQRQAPVVSAKKTVLAQKVGDIRGAGTVEDAEKAERAAVRALGAQRTAQKKFANDTIRDQITLDNTLIQITKEHTSKKLTLKKLLAAQIVSIQKKEDTELRTLASRQIAAKEEDARREKALIDKKINNSLHALDVEKETAQKQAAFAERYNQLQKDHSAALEMNVQKNITATRRRVALGQQETVADQKIKAAIEQRILVGDRLTTAEKELIRQIKIKITHNRQLSTSEQGVASAIASTTTRAAAQSAAFIRLGKSILKVQQTIARIRNAMLVYGFAIHAIIDPVTRMIRKAAELEKGTTALNIVGTRLGMSLGAVNKAARSLTEDGLINIAQGSLALSRILTTGIGLPKAVELLKAFKDAAVFGGQGTRSLNDNLIVAIDGFRNFMSRALDNIGITKNASVIMAEYGRSVGRSVESMTELERHQALANGLIKEAAIFSGSAYLATQTLTGQVERLSNAWDLLAASIGSSERAKNIIEGFADSFFSLSESLRSGGLSDLEKTLEIMEELSLVEGERYKILVAQNAMMQSLSLFKLEMPSPEAATLEAVLHIFTGDYWKNLKKIGEILAMQNVLVKEQAAYVAEINKTYILTDGNMERVNATALAALNVFRAELEVRKALLLVDKKRSLLNAKTAEEEAAVYNQSAGKLAAIEKALLKTRATILSLKRQTGKTPLEIDLEKIKIDQLSAQLKAIYTKRSVAESRAAYAEYYEQIDEMAVASENIRNSILKKGTRLIDENLAKSLDARWEQWYAEKKIAALSGKSKEEQRLEGLIVTEQAFSDTAILESNAARDREALAERVDKNLAKYSEDEAKRLISIEEMKREQILSAMSDEDKQTAEIQFHSDKRIAEFTRIVKASSIEAKRQIELLKMYTEAESGIVTTATDRIAAERRAAFEREQREYQRRGDVAASQVNVQLFERMKEDPRLFAEQELAKQILAIQESTNAQMQSVAAEHQDRIAQEQGGAFGVAFVAFWEEERARQIRDLERFNEKEIGIAREALGKKKGVQALYQQAVDRMRDENIARDLAAIQAKLAIDQAAMREEVIANVSNLQERDRLIKEYDAAIVLEAQVASATVKKHWNDAFAPDVETIQTQMAAAQQVFSAWSTAFNALGRVAKDWGNDTTSEVLAVSAHLMNAASQISNLIARSATYGPLGTIGAGIGIAASLYGVLKGDAKDTDPTTTARRGMEVGGTITRGPQIVNINPTIVNQADGGWIVYSQDGAEILRQTIIDMVAQSVDRGELAGI